MGVASRLLDGVSSGAGGCLVITAPTGFGKTHVLDAIAGEATKRSIDIRRAAAHGGVVAPFSIVATALRHSTSPSHDPAQPSIIEAGANGAADAWMVEQFLDIVDRLVLDGPLALVLDDVHQADPASVAVVQAVHERLDLLPVALVLGCRRPDPGTAFGRWWPVLQQQGSMLELPPLSDDALTALCDARFRQPPGPRLMRRLQATGGLPLLATTTLDTVADAGADLSGGRVEIDQETERRVGDAIPDPVRTRLEAVVGGDGIVVAAAAIAGASFSAADVAEVLQTPLITVVDVVGRLERAGIVVAAGSDHRFRHEQFRNAAAGSVSPPLAASLHRRFADVLGARGESPLMVVDHVLGSGATGREAASWLGRAAELLVRSDVAAALSLLERALAIDPTPDRSLQLLHFRAVCGLGRVAEAEMIARRILLDATPSEEVTLRRELAVTLFVDGRSSASIDELSRAAEIESDPPGRRRLMAEQAFMLLLSGDFGAAGEMAQAAVAEVDALGDRRTSRDVVAQLGADMVNGLVTLYRGELDAAEAIAGRMVSMAELRGTDDATLYQPWFSASVIQLELGDFATARRINGVGRARSIGSGYFWAVPGYDALDAAAHFQQGNLDDARASAVAALAAGVRDAYGANLWAASVLARCSMLRGEVEAARTQLAEAKLLARSDQAQLGVDHLTMAEIALLEHDGAVREALELAAATWDVFEAWQLDTPRQELSLDLVRLAAAAGDSARVAQVVAHLERVSVTAGRPRFALDAELARWLAADAVLSMDRVEGRSVRLESHARVREQLAQAYRGLGHGLRLVRLDRRGTGRSVASTEGGVLTRSERAVAQLLADGLTNTEIAARLIISRRTVESHVSATYRKLRVTNRVELARRIRSMS